MIRRGIVPQGKKEIMNYRLNRQRQKECIGRERERQTDRRTDRQTNRQTDRQTDRQS